MEAHPGSPEAPGAGGTLDAGGTSDAGEVLSEKSAFLRRLLPLPGPESITPSSLLRNFSHAGTMPSGPVDAAAAVVGQLTDSIVAQAASILDQEMAKGVFSAHSVARPQNNPVLRQIHDLVDNLAAMWPAAQGGEGHLTPRQQGANENKSSSIHLKPVAPCKPGERVAISMTLRNSESRPVHLVPAGTDLLGSRGGQIACSLLEFAPAEITLEPQQQEDLAVSITIPASAARGCYAGLLVLRGLENLHAIITIEVD